MLGSGVVTFALLLVGAHPTIAQSAPSREKVPKTVDEAVLMLKSELSAADKDYLLRTPRDHAVATLHVPYGTGVRNRFKLWGGNPELMSSCGVRQAEDCSGVIFASLWHSVRADSDPGLVRRLDCQFKLVEQIDINYSGFEEMKTGEMLENLQQQIDHGMAGLAKSGSQACQTSLQLKITGDPNLSCFVRAEFAKEKSPHHVSLDMLLGWIGWRNGFEALHDPPAIMIHFNDKCAWPKPPNI